ncbi:MAG TPA: hypothetical protein VIO36_12090 [Anaerolineaceae bacterium]
MNLAEMRARVRAALADSNGLVWKDELIDASLREALDMLSLALPRKRSVELDAPAGAEIELVGLPGLLDVLEVWRAATDWLPVKGWALLWHGNLPRLRLYPRAAANTRLRVVYAALHTLEGLDGALETSLEDQHVALLVNGAAGFAVERRACMAIAGYQKEPKESVALLQWSVTQLRGFENDLRRLRPRTLALAEWGE